MDIRAALEREHSKNVTNRIINYIDNSEERFAELMEVFLGEDKRISQRSAWPLSYIISRNNALLEPYFEDCVELLKKDVHPALKRNILRSLQSYLIPEQFEGILFDICYEFAYANTQPIAIRVFSLGVLFNLTIRHPELMEEFYVLIESIEEVPQSPGMRSKLRHIKKDLQKLAKK